MRTQLVWHDSVAKRLLEKGGHIPKLPEDCLFGCIHLQKDDKIRISIQGYCTVAPLLVTDSHIDFAFTPIDYPPYGDSCECTQWVIVVPEWDESEDSITG